MIIIMIRPATLPCVLLFSCAFLVLFFLNVNVEASSSSNGNGVVGKVKETTLPEDKKAEIIKAAKEIEGTGKEIMEFYENINKNIDEVLQIIKNVENDITKVESDLTPAAEQAEEQGRTAEISRRLTDAKNNKINKVVKYFTDLKSKQDIKQKISNAEISIQTLKKSTTDIKNNVDGKNDISKEKAEELGNLAEEAKSSLQKIFDKTNEQFTNFKEIDKLLSQANTEIDEIINLVEGNLKQNAENIKTKLESNVKKPLSTCSEITQKIATALKTLQENATKFVKLCDGLKIKSEELIQILNKSENNKLVEDEKSNLENTEEKTATQLSTEQVEKSKEQNSNLLEQNDMQEKEEKKENYNEEEQSSIDNNKQKQEKLTLSSGDSSTVLVTHFNVFLVFTVLCAEYL